MFAYPVFLLSICKFSFSDFFPDFNSATLYLSAAAQASFCLMIRPLLQTLFLLLRGVEAQNDAFLTEFFLLQNWINHFFKYNLRTSADVVVVVVVIG